MQPWQLYAFLLLMTSCTSEPVRPLRTLSLPPAPVAPAAEPRPIPTRSVVAPAAPAPGPETVVSPASAPAPSAPAAPNATPALTPSPAVAPAVATASRESPPPPAPVPIGPTVTFFDNDVFDKQLSASLRRGTAAVVVTFEATPSVNDIPARLNKWLSAVEKYNGTVALQPDPDYPLIAQRGAVFEVFSLMVDAFAALYKAIENKILFGPAKGYDSTVYYIKGTGAMTRVVFTRKPQAS